MLEKNAKRILKKLKESDMVLDLGGWAYPFNRANFVVDIQPYETRGFFGSQGGEKEYFNKNTWIIHDLSSKESLPFKDKQFDFVICSHILEDIRDPLWLCSEIIRVGKRGYIEVPSLELELTKGIMDKKYVGFYHHRWLIEIKKNKLVFRFKPHFIHNKWKFYFPKKYLKRLSEEKKVSFLFWKDKFDFEERIQISRDKFEEEIYKFVKSKKVYPDFFYKIDRFFILISGIKNKIKRKIFPNSYYHRYMNAQEYISKG